MTHHSDQQQHDLTDEQYGQQPASTGTGTRTGAGMSEQPQFGGSTRQPDTGTPGTEGSMPGHQQGAGQMGGSSMGGESRGEQRGAQQLGGGPTTRQQGGSMGGQRTGSRGMQGGGREQRPHSFEDHLTTELWIALEDFAELSHITAWCAKECAAAGIGPCARICQDIAEIAELNEMLISRDSMFGPEAARMFVRVAREALPQLQRYQQQHPHILETVAAIDRTMESCRTLLEMVEGGGGAGREMSDQLSGRGRTSGQQTGGQSMGGQQTSGRSMGGQQGGGGSMGGRRQSGQWMGGQQRF